MDEFYFDIVLRWIIFLVLFIMVIKDGKDFIVLRKSKFLICSLIVIYYIIVSLFSNAGWIRPILSESELSTLQVSEGIGVLRSTGKADFIHLNTNRTEFDFSLCIPYINERKLHDQQLKIWHKGRMVYQLSRNGEVIFSIENANNNIKIYNTLVVPLGYFIALFCDFYICFAFVYYKNKK